MDTLLREDTRRTHSRRRLVDPAATSASTGGRHVQIVLRSGDESPTLEKTSARTQAPGVGARGPQSRGAISDCSSLYKIALPLKSHQRLTIHDTATDGANWHRIRSNGISRGCMSSVGRHCDQTPCCCRPAGLLCSAPVLGAFSRRGKKRPLGVCSARRWMLPQPGSMLLRCTNYHFSLRPQIAAVSKEREVVSVYDGKTPYQLGRFTFASRGAASWPPLLCCIFVFTTEEEVSGVSLRSATTQSQSTLRLMLLSSFSAQALEASFPGTSEELGAPRVRSPDSDEACLRGAILMPWHV